MKSSKLFWNDGLCLKGNVLLFNINSWLLFLRLFFLFNKTFEYDGEGVIEKLIGAISLLAINFFLKDFVLGRVIIGSIIEQ